MTIFWKLTVLIFCTSIFADEVNQVANSEKMGALIEPDPVKFSFDTVGWYIIGILLLLVAVVVFFKWLHKYRKNAYRREALKILAKINDEIVNKSVDSGLSQLFILLKRVAIQTYGRPQVAALYGNEWISFLEEKGKDTPFSEYTSEFTNILYSGNGLDDSKLLKIISLSKKWIATHA